LNPSNNSFELFIKTNDWSYEISGNIWKGNYKVMDSEIELIVNKKIDFSKRDEESELEEEEIEDGLSVVIYGKFKKDRKNGGIKVALFGVDPENPKLNLLELSENEFKGILAVIKPFHISVN
jgi:hypothetical protein